MEGKKQRKSEETFLLCEWFEKNHRPLPWRASKKPYPIWVSEIMLQQTTVKAVIPFYEKFIKKFPSIKVLAQAPLDEVYRYWAGLGYYSRARNLHRSAKEISKKTSFPKTYKELLKLPGFGNYTARAVSSQAFGEAVGVVDGNVVRVLCRRLGLAMEFWKSQEQKKLQDFADQYALSAKDPGVLNQSLMELGATICTPTNPTCFLCPLKKVCVALKKNEIKNLPLKKPKRQPEIWQWSVNLYEKRGKIAFVKNQYAPFLKNQMIFPGQVLKKTKPPRFFDFQHSITHHRIYVSIKKQTSLQDSPKIRQPQSPKRINVKNRLKMSQKKPTKKINNLETLEKKSFLWVPLNRIKEKSPFSIIQKILDKTFPDFDTTRGIK